MQDVTFFQQLKELYVHDRLSFLVEADLICQRLDQVSWIDL